MLPQEADPQPDGVLLTLQKQTPHRWDRLAQNHTAVKSFLKKDWVQDPMLQTAMNHIPEAGGRVLSRKSSSMPCQGCCCKHNEAQDDGELEEEQEEVDLPSGQNVKKVTVANLDRLLQHHSLVVLAARFPWCDKCKEKDREFTKAARISRDKDHLDMVSFAVLDAREEKHFARDHNVSCTDSCDLLLFKQDERDEPYMVPGRRFAEEVQIDCYKHLLPVVSEVANKTHFDRVTTAFDTAIVGFFHLTKGEDPWYPRFRAVARQLRGHALFGAAFNGLVPQAVGLLKGYPCTPKFLTYATATLNIPQPSATSSVVLFLCRTWVSTGTLSPCRCKRLVGTPNQRGRWCCSSSQRSRFEKQLRLPGLKRARVIRQLG